MRLLQGRPNPPQQMPGKPAALSGWLVQRLPPAKPLARKLTRLQRRVSVDRWRHSRMRRMQSPPRWLPEAPGLPSMRPPRRARLNRPRLLRQRSTPLPQRRQRVARRDPPSRREPSRRRAGRPLWLLLLSLRARSPPRQGRGLRPQQTGLNHLRLSRRCLPRQSRLPSSRLHPRLKQGARHVPHSRRDRCCRPRRLVRARLSVLRRRCRQRLGLLMRPRPLRRLPPRIAGHRPAKPMRSLSAQPVPMRCRRSPPGGR